MQTPRDYVFSYPVFEAFARGRNVRPIQAHGWDPLPHIPTPRPPAHWGARIPLAAALGLAETVERPVSWAIEAAIPGPNVSPLRAPIQQLQATAADTLQGTPAESVGRFVGELGGYATAATLAKALLGSGLLAAAKAPVLAPIGAGAATLAQAAQKSKALQAAARATKAVQPITRVTRPAALPAAQATAQAATRPVVNPLLRAAEAIRRPVSLADHMIQEAAISSALYPVLEMTRPEGERPEIGQYIAMTGLGGVGSYGLSRLLGLAARNIDTRNMDNIVARAVAIDTTPAQAAYDAQFAGRVTAPTQTGDILVDAATGVQHGAGAVIRGVDSGAVALRNKNEFDAFRILDHYFPIDKPRDISPDALMMYARSDINSLVDPAADVAQEGASLLNQAMRRRQAVINNLRPDEARTAYNKLMQTLEARARAIPEALVARAKPVAQDPATRAPQDPHAVMTAAPPGSLTTPSIEEEEFVRHLDAIADYWEARIKRADPEKHKGQIQTMLRRVKQARRAAKAFRDGEMTEGILKQANQAWQATHKQPQHIENINRMLKRQGQEPLLMTKDTRFTLPEVTGVLDDAEPITMAGAADEMGIVDEVLAKEAAEEIQVPLEKDVFLTDTAERDLLLSKLQEELAVAQRDKRYTKRAKELNEAIDRLTTTNYIDRALKDRVETAWYMRDQDRRTRRVNFHDTRQLNQKRRYATTLRDLSASQQEASMYSTLIDRIDQNIITHKEYDDLIEAWQNKQNVLDQTIQNLPEASRDEMLQQATALGRWLLPHDPDAAGIVLSLTQTLPQGKVSLDVFNQFRHLWERHGNDAVAQRLAPVIDPPITTGTPAVTPSTITEEVVEEIKKDTAPTPKKRQRKLKETPITAAMEEQPPTLKQEPIIKQEPVLEQAPVLEQVSEQVTKPAAKPEQEPAATPKKQPNATKLADQLGGTFRRLHRTTSEYLAEARAHDDIRWRGDDVATQPRPSQTPVTRAYKDTQNALTIIKRDAQQVIDADTTPSNTRAHAQVLQIVADQVSSMWKTRPDTGDAFYSLINKTVQTIDGLKLNKTYYPESDAWKALRESALLQDNPKAIKRLDQAAQRYWKDLTNELTTGQTGKARVIYTEDLQKHPVLGVNGAPFKAVRRALMKEDARIMSFTEKILEDIGVTPGGTVKLSDLIKNPTVSAHPKYFPTKNKHAVLLNTLKGMGVTVEDEAVFMHMGLAPQNVVDSLRKLYTNRKTRPTFVPIVDITEMRGSLPDRTLRILPNKLANRIRAYDQQAALTNSKLRDFVRTHGAPELLQSTSPERSEFDRLILDRRLVANKRERLTAVVRKYMGDAQVGKYSKSRLQKLNESPVSKIGSTIPHYDATGKLIGDYYITPIKGEQIFLPAGETITKAHEDLLGREISVYARTLGVMRDVFTEPVMNIYRNTLRPLQHFEAEFQEGLYNVLRPIKDNVDALERVTLRLEGTRAVGLTQQEEAAVLALREWYNRLFKEFGLDADRFLTDYAPRIRKAGSIRAAFGNDVPEELRFFAEFERDLLAEEFPTERNALTAALAYLRIGAKKKFIQPAMDAAAPLAAAMSPTRRGMYDAFVNTVLHRPLWEERLTSNLISEMMDSIKKDMGPRAAHTFAHELADVTTNAIYMSTISGNLNTILKNLTQSALTIGGLDGSIITGVKGFSRAIRDLHTPEGKKLLRYCWVLQNRKYLEGLENQSRLFSGRLRLVKKVSDKIGMAGFEWTDRQNVAIAYMAKLRQSLANGSALADAVREANDFALDTQFGYGIDSPLFYKTPAGKLMGVLTSYPVNYLRLLHKYWRTGGSEGKRKLINIIGTQALLWPLLSATGLDFSSTAPMNTARSWLPVAYLNPESSGSIPVQAVFDFMNLVQTGVTGTPMDRQEALNNTLEHFWYAVPFSVGGRRFYQAVQTILNQGAIYDDRDRLRRVMSPWEQAVSFIGPTTPAREHRDALQQTARTDREYTDLRRRTIEAFFKYQETGNLKYRDTFNQLQEEIHQRRGRPVTRTDIRQEIRLRNMTAQERLAQGVPQDYVEDQPTVSQRILRGLLRATGVN